MKAQPNDVIADQIRQDKEKAARDKIVPAKKNTPQVETAKIAWTLGALAIDIATAYAIYVITGYFWYGVFWIVAGGGGLIWSQWIKERVGNNAEQNKIGEAGVIVSGLAVLIMAFVTGVVFVLGMTGLLWVEALTVVATVGLFLYHVFQAYRYHEADDDITAAQEEARAEARALKEIREIHRAARVVEAKKKALQLLSGYEGEHGDAIRAALEGTSSALYNADTPRLPQVTTAGSNGHEKTDPT